VTPHRLLSIVFGFVVLAAACSADGSDTTIAPSSTVPSSSDEVEEADTQADASVEEEVVEEEVEESPSSAPTGFRAPAIGDGEHLPALDPDADPTPFAVDRTASTAREDVPSALRGDRTDPSFPEPLIPLDRILSGGPPPDGIPPLDAPLFEAAASVDWLSAVEPVLVVEVEGDARAYPIQIMTWHEIVNDVIGGVPVTVAYCPLCNSALAYDRRLGDRILDFGTSGELFNSSLVMYDRQTESLWTHFDSRAVVGHLAGETLDTFSVQVTSWEQFRDANPDGIVLSLDTGFGRSYGRNPYFGYDTPDETPFLFDGTADPRLDPKQRVIAVRDDAEPAVVVPLLAAFEAGAFAFEAHGRELVAIVDPGVSSPLDAGTVDEGFDQGAAAVYVNELDGVPLDLARTERGFVDAVSGLTFDVFGVATDGSGVRLESVEHLDTFWFAIAAFEPEAEIIGG
jgi:hypothetical protein